MDRLRALLTISFLSLCTSAHMQMSSPYPINSPLNPDTAEPLKDYSYTSPLLSDGSNFPCKGYQTQSTSYNTTTTYTAGDTYSMSIVGTATHGGGSCQLSLSYDNGQTFKVIQSMIGGCPITTTYSFTIPSFAPSSPSALFAWTWFNEIGNREMYMDCARVQIQAVVPGRHRRAQHKRQASMNSLPDLFVCNVSNGCTTIEQEDVQFPDPGANILYGADDGTYPPLNGSGFTGSGYAMNSATLNPNMPSAMPTSSPYANATTISSILLPNTTASTTTAQLTSTLVVTDVTTFATTILVRRTTSSLSPSITSAVSTVVAAAATMVKAPTTMCASVTSSPPQLSSLLGSPSTTFSVFTTTSSTFSSTTITVTSTSASTSASATLLPGPCTPGTFACDSTNTFSQCVVGVGSTSSYTYMGSVAGGMKCSNGQIIRQNDGPCTPSGQLFCHSEYAFYLCDQGGLINMGPVAPGTACVNGVIGYPPSRL